MKELNEEGDLMKELTEEEMKTMEGGGACISTKRIFLRLVIDKEYQFSKLIAGEYSGGSKVGEVMGLNGDYMKIIRIKLVTGEKLVIKNVSEGRQVAMQLPIRFSSIRNPSCGIRKKGTISIYEISCQHGSQVFILNIRVFGSYFPGCI